MSESFILSIKVSSIVTVSFLLSFLLDYISHCINNNCLKFVYSSELGESVCTVTEEVVSLQQNCVDCLKNVSSVLLTEEGSRMYIGAKSLLLSVDMDKCETTSTVSYKLFIFQIR